MNPLPIANCFDTVSDNDCPTDTFSTPRLNVNWLVVAELTLAL